MTFSTQNEEGKTILKIEGELDALSVVELREAIDRVAEQRNPTVMVDLSALRLIDSSGVGAIVSLYKRVRAYGGAMTAVGVRDQPLAILRLLHLDRILMS